MREAIEGRGITPADDAKPEIKVVLIGADVRPQYEKHAADQASMAGDRLIERSRIIEVITPRRAKIIRAGRLGRGQRRQKMNIQLECLLIERHLRRQDRPQCVALERLQRNGNHAQGAGQSITEAFSIGEKEQLVPDNGAAKRGRILIGDPVRTRGFPKRWRRNCSRSSPTHYTNPASSRGTHQGAPGDWRRKVRSFSRDGYDFFTAYMARNPVSRHRRLAAPVSLYR
jgi:hypothetical protein